jgi:hypothetical protein
MNSHRTHGSLLLTAVIAVVGAFIAISACDTTQSLPSLPAAENSSTTATGVVTAIPTDTEVVLSPTENATVALQEFEAGAPPGWFSDPTNAAVATQIPIRRSQYLTAIALTPTLPPFPYTPEPTRTPGLGMIHDTGCVLPVHDGEPQFPSCWDAYVNGRWIFVAAGYRGGGIGAYNPPPRSLIFVCPEPVYFGSSDAVTYETPANEGEVRIASISGSLVTIVPRDPNNHASFVFDLATRQWVNSPTPGPSPSVSVSPIPSVSPLPTQMP